MRPRSLVILVYPLMVEITDDFGSGICGVRLRLASDWHMGVHRHRLCYKGATPGPISSPMLWGP